MVVKYDVFKHLRARVKSKSNVLNRKSSVNITMRSLLVVDLDKQCFRYVVKVNRIVIGRVELAEITENRHVYSIPEDYFVGWFVWNLQNDMVFRRRIRSMIRSRDSLMVLQLRPAHCQVDLKRYECGFRN